MFAMLQKNKGRIVWGYAVDALFFLAGSVLYAVAINMFTAPNNIAPGGATGIATLVNYLSGAPIGTVMLLLNVPLFIWGWLELGYRFVARTIAATVSTSAVLDLLAPFLPQYQGDTMLAAIFGGIFAGAGLALIFMRGGTTGGSDLVARLIARHFRHISMGRLILIIDVAVVLASAAVYRNYESPLYALIVIFINTRLIDNILYGVDEGNGKMMFIISQKSREIAVNVQVKAPTAATVDVAVTVKTAEGTDFANVKTAVETDLAEQFNGKLLGRGVKLAELNSRIYALPGVENCHITAPSADLAANDTVLPVLGTVTVTEEA